MSPDSVSRRSFWSFRCIPRYVTAVAAVATCLRIAVAPAVAAGVPFNEVADRSELMQVVDRFGGATLGLILVAVAIIALLVGRVVVMIRRERPVRVPPPKRQKAAFEPDSLALATTQPMTDWGFDQNKRAALARSPVVLPNADVDLPSLDHAVTQWSVSDVHKAVNDGVQTTDALGQSPMKSTSPYRTSFNPYFKPEERSNGFEVVEVADALLQAELLVQLGDPKQAMTLLSHHIRETEKPGPAAWLMLLNLYQSTGREAQYNALASGFRTLFNAEVPAWATSPAAMARELESYPQVMMRLQTTWPGPLARATVEGMLNDDRGGSRQGFSLYAYRELLFLAEILLAIDAIDQDEEDRRGIGRKLGTLPS